MKDSPKQLALRLDLPPSIRKVPPAPKQSNLRLLKIVKAKDNRYLLLCMGDCGETLWKSIDYLPRIEKKRGKYRVAVN